MMNSDEHRFMVDRCSSLLIIVLRLLA